MATIVIKTQDLKDKIGAVKDLRNHPFFVKKASEAKEFLQKHGLPKK